MANVPPATVTITSTTGPGQAVTALVLTGVTDIEVDFKANTIRIINNGIETFFDYSAVTTFTWTITGGSAAITIS